jgi:RHS repeat-associated protein
MGKVGHTYGGSQGKAVERYAYTPYGEMAVLDAAGTPKALQEPLQPYGYTGRRYDSETGLWYFRTRYLDSKLGRFLNRNPWGSMSLSGTWPYSIMVVDDAFFIRFMSAVYHSEGAYIQGRYSLYLFARGNSNSMEPYSTDSDNDGTPDYADSSPYGDRDLGDNYNPETDKGSPSPGVLSRHQAQRWKNYQREAERTKQRQQKERQARKESLSQRLDETPTPPLPQRDTLKELFGTGKGDRSPDPSAASRLSTATLRWYELTAMKSLVRVIESKKCETQSQIRETQRLRLKMVRGILKSRGEDPIE